MEQIRDLKILAIETIDLQGKRFDLTKCSLSKVIVNEFKNGKKLVLRPKTKFIH